MMHIILIIIVISIIIAIFEAAGEWFKEHTLGTIWCVAVIVSFFVQPVLGIVLAVSFVVYTLSMINKAANNEKELRDYLAKNCTNKGCLADVDISTIAPQFVSKTYKDTTYNSIVIDFIDAVENEKIKNDRKLNWLKPALEYLDENKMADVYELEKISSEKLSFSHFTPDGEIICEAMQGLCATKIINGIHKYSRVKIEEEGVKKELNYPSDKKVPEYYLWVFQINDTSKKTSVNSGNLVMEELSADDLGIDM